MHWNTPRSCYLCPKDGCNFSTAQHTGKTGCNSNNAHLKLQRVDGAMRMNGGGDGSFHSSTHHGYHHHDGGHERQNGSYGLLFVLSSFQKDNNDLLIYKVLLCPRKSKDTIICALYSFFQK